MNDELVVFPTSRAVRKYVSLKKNINKLLPKLITISDFFNNSISLKNFKYIDSDLRILYLKQAIDVKYFEQIGISKDFSTFFKQSDFIFRFLAELSNENINIDTLFEYDSYEHYTDHLKILKIIQNNYLKILNENNFVDKINLPINYKINEQYLKEFKSIHIILEGYLSHFELKIINDAAKTSNITIEFDYNIFNQKSIHKINNDANKLYLNNHYKIDLSTNEILYENKTKTNNYKLELSSFESRIDQISFIKQSVYSFINDYKIDPVDIVVVLPDESFAKYINVFDKENYFNFAFGYDINDTFTYKIVESINNYFNEKNDQASDTKNFYEIDESIIKLLQNSWNKKIDIDILTSFNDYILNNEPILNVKEEYEKCMHSIVQIFIKNNIDIKLRELFKIIILKLNKVTIDDKKGGEVTVMGLLETRNIKFKGVIVCDFNDDKIPKVSTKDKFISSTIKELSSLPTFDDRQNLQAYYYNKLFENSQVVHISYVKNDSNIISRFSHILFGDRIKSNNTHEQYKNILYQNQLKIYEKKAIDLDIDMSKQTWSATSLKIYLQCKRKYYYQNLTGLKHHHFSVKPQNFEIGNILHNTLNKIYKENNYFDCEKELKNKIFYNMNLAINTNPYLLFDIEFWKMKLDAFVKNEIIRFRSGIKVFDTEKHFKLIHNNIQIQGSIDRIDIFENKEYDILDYKTSSSLKLDTSKNYQKSNDFQLEFYYLGLSNTHKNINNVAYYDLNNGLIKNESVLDDKLVLLDSIFDELKTTNVKFDKCEDKKECIYCPYNVMCERI